MSAPVDPSITTLPLSTPVSRGVVVCSIVFGVISLVLVATRLTIKVRDRMWAWDDTFLAIGTAFYMPDTAIAIKAAFRGVGHVNAEYNAFLAVESMKWYYLWIIFYVIGLVFIKTSVCLTILRITGTNKHYRWSVYALIVCTFLSFLVVFLGLMFFCIPMEGVWNPALVVSGQARCLAIEKLIILSYASTAGTIITDLGCAILPAVILWRTQMRPQQKFAVAGLLSFASAASITTVIRTPYIDHYNTPTDNLMFWMAHIILFSNVETGIGCIATSLPALRMLWMRSRSEEGREANSSGNKSNPANRNLVTIGSTPLSARSKKSRGGTDPANTFATVYAHGDGDWERLDAASDKELVKEGGIRAEYSFAVEMQDAPQHSNGPAASSKDHV